MQLAMLYTFADLTLLGRVMLFSDGYRPISNATYLFFSGFSAYTFLMTALAYQLFTLDITNLTRKMRFIEESKQAENVLKHDK